MEKDKQAVQIATGIKVHKKFRCLQVSYPNGVGYKLPCEYLQVFSPVAEEKE